MVDSMAERLVYEKAASLEVYTVAKRDSVVVAWLVYNLVDQMVYY